MDIGEIQNTAIEFLNENNNRPAQSSTIPAFNEDESFATVVVDDGIDHWHVRVNCEDGTCEITQRN